MAAIPVDTVPFLRPRPQARWAAGGSCRPLLAPSLLFLAVFFALPALGLVSYSFLTQAPDGTVGLPLTLEHYRHFFATPLYSRVLLTTLQISLCTTARRRCSAIRSRWSWCAARRSCGRRSR